MVATLTRYGVGQYWTAQGRRAVVDAVADGILVGRINLQDDPAKPPHWWPAMWTESGNAHGNGPQSDKLQAAPGVPVRQRYWLNIYDDGPGLLRETWEQALIEAGSQEKQPLCRVEVKVDSFVGQGLK